MHSLPLFAFEIRFCFVLFVFLAWLPKEKQKFCCFSCDYLWLVTVDVSLAVVDSHHQTHISDIDDIFRRIQINDDLHDTKNLLR